MDTTKTNGAVPAVETEGLTKYYGVHRGIVDLDLSVRQGEVFGFLGPNGAGKTTTIRLLLDLIRPTSGNARIFGKDVHREAVDVKKLIGYLPGEMSLWPGLTARQILTYLGNLRGGVNPKQIDSTAERLQLDLDKRFRELSKGNKQKVGLVQALMHKPRLLVLDEPTAGLDPLNQQEFFQMMVEASQDGATVFLSSHILSEVEHTCDRVAIIREGRLVRIGTTSEVTMEKHYHITVTFGVPVEGLIADAFAGLHEVSELQATDGSLQFVVHGSLDSVVKTAARYPVVSFTSHEPTLEEAFLEYYRAEGQEPAAAPAEPPLVGAAR